MKTTLAAKPAIKGWFLTLSLNLLGKGPVTTGIFMGHAFCPSMTPIIYSLFCSPSPEIIEVKVCDRQTVISFTQYMGGCVFLFFC